MRGALISLRDTRVSSKIFSKTPTSVLVLAFSAMLAAAAAAQAHAEEEAQNDYPTEARADYVFGCMASNGQTREALHRCACSLDVIASILPYDRYVSAETVLSMRQSPGRAANAFHSAVKFDDIVADLRRAQAESEIRCFK
jgi:hypothetical protein